MGNIKATNVTELKAVKIRVHLRILLVKFAHSHSRVMGIPIYAVDLVKKHIDNDARILKTDPNFI